MTFSPEQTYQLLQPIHARRVLADGKGHSHVSQQDVVAHLIRVFGFGHFNIEVIDLELLYEQVRPESQIGEYTTGNGASKVTHDKAENPHQWRYDVAYRAGVRLTIFNDKHEPYCYFEDQSTGNAMNSTRADAHDLALKSAISVAKKRCAINLGDQFGLSLYNKGQMKALVIGTKVYPPKYDEYVEKITGEKADDKTDLQSDVPQQESLGTDETIHDDHRPEAEEITEEQRKTLEDSLGAKEIEDGGKSDG